MITPSLHLATAYVLAAFGACAPQNVPVLHFNVTETPPAFSSGYTTTDLHKMAPAISFANPAEFPITSGLTLGKIGLKTGVSFSMLELPFGYCMWPTEVDVTLTYNAQVYIAQEYPLRNSCRYNETRLHELRHVAADEDAIREFLPSLQAAAAAETARLAPQGPFNASERDAVKNSVFNQVNAALKAELGKIDDVRRTRQQAIDTAAEYRRLSGVCPGEPLR